ncbi:MAG: carbohydrate binding domain-containing protein [Pirellulaceae bacterium]
MNQRFLGIGIVAMSLVAAANSLGWAQVPNGSFEEGAAWPDGWRVTGGIGTWENGGHSGGRCVSLTEDGKGAAGWRSATFPLQPNKTYLLSGWVKVDAGAHPWVCFGTSELFWSFPIEDHEWHRYEFFFPSSPTAVSSEVRFWIWHHRCRFLLDDVALVEAQAVHATRGGIELGVGERVHGNLYQAGPEFPLTMGVAGPGCRILCKPQDYGFNGRWYVNPQGVVLRHQVGDVEQTEAWLRFYSGWNPRGNVIVSASKDGQNYLQLYETRKLYWNGPITLPAQLFPAKEIFIRFQCVETPDDQNQEKGLTFELVGYEYQAKLTKELHPLEGKTEFIEIAR